MGLNLICNPYGHRGVVSGNKGKSKSLTLEDTANSYQEIRVSNKDKFNLLSNIASGLEIDLE